MKKISLLLFALISTGCVLISCSDEDQLSDDLRIHEFKQKSQKLADQYGLMIMFSNEYILERINWSDSQLEQEMKEISNSFLESDSLGTRSDKRSMRRRMIGSYEIIREIYSFNRDENLQFQSGLNTITFSAHIEWNSDFMPNGSVGYGNSFCQIVHNCNPDCPLRNRPNHESGTSYYSLVNIVQKGNMNVYGIPSYNHTADVTFTLDIGIECDTLFEVKNKTFSISVPYETSPVNSLN